MFSDIGEVVAYAKKRMPLEQVVRAHLLNDKQEGRALLLDSTLKAALAACLWNQTTALVSAVDTVKNGKKTTLVKQWLKATASLMGAMPINESGDVGQISDLPKFVDGCNAAIEKWAEGWSLFDHLQVVKQEQRASKPVVATPAPAPAPAPAPVKFENSTEAALLRDEVAEATEALAQEKNRSATALRVAREKDSALVTASARIQELEALLRASEESRIFLQLQLQKAGAEIQMLRDSATPARKTRGSKVTTP